MKSKYLLLITAVLLSVSFSSFAQMSVIVHKNDGTTHEFMFSDVDSLKFSKIQPGMVFVEGGRFWQGARDSTSSSNQYPLHQVELSDFYILNTEVTYGLWRSVMDTIPGYKNSDDHPAVSISFYEMVDFCNKLSASENRTPCYYYID